ncbi:MAG: hypothetical protein ACTSSI_03045 [Candidatus Helarchaeota archaeon]
MGLTEEETTLGASIIKEHDHVPLNKLDLELASMFSIMEYFKYLANLKNARYHFFSKSLWPLFLVQVGPERYIAIDGLNFFSLRFEITDAPGTIQSKISRLMRDTDAKTSSTEDFKNVLDECEALIKGISRREIFIKGIIEPDLLKGIATLLKHEESNVSSMLADLDCVHTSDQALDIAGEYATILKQIDGNMQNWKNLLRLIEETTDNWLSSIKRKIKNLDKRITSEIYRKQDEVKAQMAKLQKSKSDGMFNLTEWLSKRRTALTLKIHEKHRLLASYLRKYVLNVESLEQEDAEPEYVLERVKNMIDEFKNGEEIKKILFSIEEGFKQIEDELVKLEDEVHVKEEEIDKKYRESLEKVGGDLPKLFVEKDMKLKDFASSQDDIEKRTESIKKLIDDVIKNCINEKNYLMRWSVLGSQIGMVVPLAKKFIPLYVAEVETSDDDEKIFIVPPIILLSKKASADQWIPFEFMNAAFQSSLKDRLEKALDTNFEIRSNFEFNCEKKNLLQNKDIAKYRMMRGFEMLDATDILEKSKIVEIKSTWMANSQFHQKTTE